MFKNIFASLASITLFVLSSIAWIMLDIFSNKTKEHPNDEPVNCHVIRQKGKKNAIFMRYARAYPIILVNKVAWDFFTYYFAKYRVTFWRGGLGLLHLSRHFPTAGGADRQIATNYQTFVRIRDDVR